MSYHDVRSLPRAGAVLAASALALCWPGSAAADKAADFKEAAGNDGCKAIPFSSERNTCVDRSNEQRKVCKGFSCEKDVVVDDLDAYKEKTKKLQEAKQRNDEQGARGIEEALKKLDDKLKGHVLEAKLRIDIAYDCLERRERVQRSFSEAKEMVQKETDPLCQPYIPALVSKYDEGRQAHVGPMQEVTKATDNCKWVATISW